MLKISLKSSICKEVTTTITSDAIRVSLPLTLSFLTSAENDVRKVQFEYRNKTLKTFIFSVYLFCSATSGHLPSNSYNENKKEKKICNFMFSNF